MNYWWVNQNQSHTYEINGGYMWSPKTNKNGARNTFYDNMERVKSGDIVFSFIGGRIPYLGIITSHGYSEPKPDLGSAGDLWNDDGWMVNVDYRSLKNPIRPKDHINVLRPLLPNKYSPLQQNGNGNQVVYLAAVNSGLAEKLLELIGEDAKPIITAAMDHTGESKTDREAIEDRIQKAIKRSSLTTTEKETLVKSRIGQGRFREDVLSEHVRCPFTGVHNHKFLRAGHLKPWAKCDNRERVDPLNGLPLSPVADLLIDQGFVSFDDTGAAIFSPELDLNELSTMGINPSKTYRVKIRNENHREYISYHRQHVYKSR